MVRLERRGRRTTRHHLHHRGLHLEETALLKEGADLTDDGKTLAENIPRVLVGNEVKVTLPVPRFHVLQAVPLFRQRMQRLAEQDEFLRLDRRLPSFRGEAFALHSDEVADVEQFVDRHRLLAERFVLQIDLHAPAVVAHVEKMALAHVAPRRDPSGQDDLSTLDEAGPHLAHVAGHGKGRAISAHAAAQ